MSPGGLVIDIQDGAETGVGPDDIGDIIEGPVEDIEEEIGGDIGEEIGEEIGGDIEGELNAGEPKEEETKDMMGGAGGGGVMAEAKKEIKEAQMMGGEMGGQGGASQAPGAGASLPAAPAPQANPLESFTGEEDLTGEGGGPEENLEPLPPGSICPVCGSEDVDIVAGKGQCNNCNSEMTYKVEVNVTRWQGVTPSEEQEGVPEEGFEGEGFEMPEAGEMGDPGGMEEGLGDGMPAVAAYTKLKPEALKKLASENIELGSVSPATGKTNTIKINDSERICLSTGTKYKVSFVVSKDGKNAYAQWEWTPKTAGCVSCSKAKQKFVKALSTVEMTEEDFNKLELKDKVATIVKLKKAGSLGIVKTADKQGSILEDYKLAYGGYGNKFPFESCMEKLSRRFGENAICLSGPDEGKPLAESVCNRLKKADVYADRVAIKVADNWSDCDGDEECITHQVRSGYDLREAVTICETLKIAVAQSEDFFGDSLGGDEEVPVEEPMEDDGGIGDDVDPFEDVDEGTVSLELPRDVVEQLDAQLDIALGEDPAAEGDIGGLEGDIGGPEGDMGGPVEEVTPEELGAVDEAKPLTDDPVQFEQEVGESCGGPEINEGIPGQGANVVIKVDGQPVSAETKTETKVAEEKKKEEEEEEEEETIASDSIDIKEAINMSGAIGKVGRPQMDLSSVVATINKKAGEKEIQQQKAQDSKDIGSYTAGENGSLMGHENETIPSAGKPSIPRDNATMGQEPEDLNPQDKPQPVVPSENATMGHEDEAGLSGGDNTYTGGDKGQGKTELASIDDDLYHMKGFGSPKDALSNLADRIAVKLAPKAPVADDPDVKPYSGNSTIGKEDKFTAETISDSEVKSNAGHIGHEQESIGEKPDSPKSHPDVHTGNAQMGQEELDSEKTTKDKGTVIAENDSKSEAYRVAGRMLQAKKIEASELQSKIDEFKTYKPEQIRDIEKGVFASVKGLNTVSDGKVSQPVQINEASSVRNSKDELSTQLKAMFTLGRQNSIADDDTDTQLRKAYRR